jgi:hypothetical protein
LPVGPGDELGVEVDISAGDQELAQPTGDECAHVLGELGVEHREPARELGVVLLCVGRRHPVHRGAVFRIGTELGDLLAHVGNAVFELLAGIGGHLGGVFQGLGDGLLHRLLLLAKRLGAAARHFNPLRPLRVSIKGVSPGEIRAAGESAGDDEDRPDHCRPCLAGRRGKDRSLACQGGEAGAQGHEDAVVSVRGGGPQRRQDVGLRAHIRHPATKEECDEEHASHARAF